MGNTFDERSNIKFQIRTRDHLRFVIQNWHLSDMVFDNKKKIKYIVTAFTPDMSKQSSNEIQEIRDEMIILKDVIDKNTNMIQ